MLGSMKRILVIAAFVCLGVFGWTAASDSGARAAEKTSGQGEMQFRVLHRSDHLPAEAQAVLKKAHGGFAVDRRAGKGETYFALPGAGIIRISADLSSTRMLATASGMKETNLHNSTVWYDASGKAFLTFPGNGSAKVYTTGLDGKLVHTLDAPDGRSDLGHPVANDYFLGGGNFVPTDTEYLDGLLYITTGYSKLDYVLTAKIDGTSPFQAKWFDLAFGGKGTGPGQLGTGHGVTVPPGTTRIDVADRPHSEVDRYTRHGQYLSTLSLPLGSFPCDIDYVDDYALVGALHGPDRGKGAPIYVLENDKLVSTVMIKHDLGLENFQHIHNAVLKKGADKWYIIAQAWNPGDFAILEQVTN